MRPIQVIKTLVLLAGVGVALQSAAATAQSVEEFYKGKTIAMILPTGPGGTYNLYGTLIAEHVAPRIPGKPNIILQFIPSGIQAMNQVYNSVPKDGSVIAMLAQTAAITQVMNPDGAKYDMKNFAALGLFAQLNAVLTVSPKSPAQDIASMKAGEISIGATDQGSYQYFIPMTMNRYLGTKFKVITGYRGIAETTLAMDRGEVDGVFTSWLAIKQRKASKAEAAGDKVILQVGYNQEADLDAPLLQDLATDEKAKRAFNFVASFSALSRSLIAPPGVPADRIAALRKAVAETMTDPAFIAAMKARNLPFSPLSWQDQQKIMDEASSTPRELVQ